MSVETYYLYNSGIDEHEFNTLDINGYEYAIVQTAGAGLAEISGVCSYNILLNVIGTGSVTTSNHAAIIVYYAEPTGGTLITSGAAICEFLHNPPTSGYAIISGSATIINIVRVQIMDTDRTVYIEEEPRLVYVELQENEIEIPTEYRELEVPAIPTYY